MKREKLYAKFYDLEYENKKDDVNFYYKLAQKIKGPILECGCGAGRIFTPMAKSGKEIWGFDTNTAMIDIAKNKIQSSKARIFQDDVTRFSSPTLSNKKFDFIFFSFDGLAYLAHKDGGGYYSPKESQERQRKAFKNISAHLHPNGFFAFDLFSPNDLSKEYVVRHHFSRAIKNETWSLFSAIHIPIERIFQIHYFMEILKTDGSSKKWHYPIAAYQATFQEIKSLLEETGLYPIKTYGDFDLKPHRNRSEQMIFICQKKKRG